jgi:hypothetical protein
MKNASAELMLMHVNMGQNGSEEMGRNNEWGDGGEWAIAAP